MRREGGKEGRRWGERKRKKSLSQPSPLGCGGSEKRRQRQELGPEEITQRHSESRERKRWEEEKDSTNSKKKGRKEKRPGRIGRRIPSPRFYPPAPVALPPESELQGLVV